MPIFPALCQTFTLQKSFSTVVRRVQIVWRLVRTSYEIDPRPGLVLNISYNLFTSCKKNIYIFFRCLSVAGWEILPLIMEVAQTQLFLFRYHPPQVGTSCGNQIQFRQLHRQNVSTFDGPGRHIRLDWQRSLSGIEYIDSCRGVDS